MKHRIWANTYDAVKAVADYLMANPGEVYGDCWDEDENISEADAWDYAQDDVSNWLEDERANLDIDIGADIIVFADLGLWNGRRTGYKTLKSRNLRDVLDVCCGDYIEWYVNENGEMIIRDSHHDGTNVYTVRALRDLSWAQLENFYGKLSRGLTTRDVKRYTRRLGDFPAKVYGWKLRGGVHA